MGIAMFCVLFFQGIIIVILLNKESQMDKLNQALTRIQASITAASAKIDALKASQGVTDADLQPVVDALNAASDTLDAKVAQ